MKAVIVAFFMLAGLAPAQQQPAPSSYSAPAPDVIQSLGRLEQAANNLNSDLTRLRIEKWKTDRPVKEQAQNDVSSVQRNIGSALPNLINEVRNRPDDLVANFRLYQNLVALHDVLMRLSYYTSSFGSREESQLLNSDAENLDSVRPAFGNRVDALATRTQAELTRIKALAQQQAAAPPQVKRIIVDDNVSPAKKKAPPKARKKPTANSAGTANKTQ